MNNYFIYCKKADFKRISDKFHISPMLARIIRNRDIIEDSEIEEYLNGGTDRLYDPFLMKGIEEAVPLLFDAVVNSRRIRIIGDYDTDGVCSSYILKTYLNFIGAKADVRLPDRMAEGYGMNVHMVRQAEEDGIELLLTCDNGVSSYEAVQEAEKAGIRVIISDHHEVPEPQIAADILIDPKQSGCSYPYPELCGAGVAYKIISAMDMKKDLYLKQEVRTSEILEELIQFAGIATVADVVPLTGENRILAREGIECLRKTKNAGLRALMQERQISTQEITSFHIGFILAPCLNSAGRLKNAEIAFRLLEEQDERKAQELAFDLSRLNEERKNMTILQTKIAENIMEKKIRKEGALPKVIVVYLPQAHESIAGIVAGRLKELYSRPALVITEAEDGKKGSGRSVESYHMVEELRKYSHLFSKLGGHMKAAGFTLSEGSTPEQVELELNRGCELSDEQLEEKKWIDMQLPFSYLSEEFISELDKLEPFGLKNERPVFAEKDIRVTKVQVFGKNHNVLKLRLENPDGYTADAIKYGSEDEILKLSEKLKDHSITFTYYPGINEFRGMRTIQIRILDVLSVS